MSLKDEVLEAIRSAPGGLTVDAVEAKLARSHQAVSPRVLELRKEGLIHDSGRRAYTRGRRWAAVWVAGRKP